MESGIYDFDTYYANFMYKKRQNELLEIESKVGVELVWAFRLGVHVQTLGLSHCDPRLKMVDIDISIV